MIKNVLLIFVLISSVLIANDWKEVESLNSNKKYNDSYELNYLIVSSTQNSCYILKEEIAFGVNYYDVYYSEDQGNSWDSRKGLEPIISAFEPKSQFISSPDPETLIMPMRISPPLGKTGVVSSDYTLALATSDNYAETFKVTEFDDLYNNNYYSEVLEVYDENNQCFIIRNEDDYHYCLLFTSDKWNSYDTLRFNTNVRYLNISYFDQSNIFVHYVNHADSDKIIYAKFNTIDKSYQELYSDTLGFGMINMINSELGFRASKIEDDYKIYKTVDGGKSWDEVYSNDKTIIEYDNYGSDYLPCPRFEFYDIQNGAIPYKGGLLLTNDGGESWVKSPIFKDTVQRNSICCWVGKSLLADGYKEKIYRYTGDFFDIPIAKTTLMLPENGKYDVPTDTKLEWTYTGMATNYNLQLSEDIDFTELILDQNGIEENTFTTSDLDSGVTYYWRVQPVNSKETGNWSEIFSFTTDWPNSVSENIESLISIVPNPAEEYIEISVNNPSEGLEPSKGSEIEIYDVLGNRVMSGSIHPMTPRHRMNVANLPKGVYFVKIGDRVEKFVKM